MKNSVIIDTKKYDLKEEEKNYLIYQYCFSKGTELPCFCYNENLEIAGNCRICLVEIEKMPKLLLACATKIEKNYDNKNKKFVILKKIEKLNENLNNFIKYEKYKYKTEKFIWNYWVTFEDSYDLIVSLEGLKNCKIDKSILGKKEKDFNNKEEYKKAVEKYISETLKLRVEGEKKNWRR